MTSLPIPPIPGIPGVPVSLVPAAPPAMPQAPSAPSAGAFSVAFQVSMIRLMLDDEGFAALAVKHLHARFFENGSLAWVFTLIQTYVGQYGRPPTPLVLTESLRQLSHEHQQQLAPTVYAVVQNPCREPEFVTSKIIEFVKRNLFVEGMAHLRTLFNGGKDGDAYDFFLERGEQIKAITVLKPDRGFFFEELAERQKRRALNAKDESHNTVATGIPDLDRVLGGGLHLGELGIWAAAPKVGKTTLLKWLAYYAVRALRIPTIVFVLEAGREPAEDSLDSAFSLEKAQLIRKGLLDASTERMLHDEYKELSNLLVLRGYTKDENVWAASVLDFSAELRELRTRHGFKPKLIIVDYGDLMVSRVPQEGTYETQKAAFRELKVLAGRDDGYALWTASQIQRPAKGYDTNEQLVMKANQIGDCFEKVRIADFIGTINRTVPEADREVCRLYAEMYRSNHAGRLIEVNTDYAHSRFFTSVKRSTPLLDEQGEQRLLEVS